LIESGFGGVQDADRMQEAVPGGQKQKEDAASTN